MFELKLVQFVKNVFISFSAYSKSVVLAIVHSLDPPEFPPQ